MVLTCPRPVAMLAIAVVVLVACLGTAPPRRLAEPAPIALVVHLETAGGEAREVPALVARELGAVLAARNLEVLVVLAPALFAEQRASRRRVDAVLGATDTPWVILVEARARFFSQLSGRYRWEVELRTSLVDRGRPDAVQVSDLHVAAFLLFEHESEPEALSFVRRQLADDVGGLIDRGLLGENTRTP